MSLDKLTPEEQSLHNQAMARLGESCETPDSDYPPTDEDSFIKMLEGINTLVERIASKGKFIGYCAPRH